MLAVLCCTTALGFLKAFYCRQRVKRLRELECGFSRLRDCVMFSGGESGELLRLCFPRAYPTPNSGELLAEECGLLSDFFGEFGTGLKESECERISLYEGRLSRLREDAEKNAGQTCRLWKTVGFCAGLAACIFLI